MYEWLTVGYELLSGMIPFGIFLHMYQRKSDIPVRDRIWLGMFAVYIIGVFYVTGAGTIYDAMRASFDDLHRRVNLIPFSREINVVGYVLNIVMFVPFGFLTSKIVGKMNSTYHTILFGFGFSLLIEISQLLTHRGTDVDDLIMNTMGAVLGWMVYRIWNRTVGCQPCGVPMKILPITILVIFAGRFFLFNMLGLINLIYGF